MTNGEVVSVPYRCRKCDGPLGRYPDPMPLGPLSGFGGQLLYQGGSTGPGVRRGSHIEPEAFGKNFKWRVVCRRCGRNEGIRVENFRPMRGEARGEQTMIV